MKLEEEYSLLFIFACPLFDYFLRNSSFNLSLLPNVRKLTTLNNDDNKLINN